MGWMKVRLEIPENLTPAQREEFGYLAAVAMADKARQGIGVRENGEYFRNKAFPRYTKEYAKRKGQSNVDLTLSGEMLDDLTLLSHRSGSVLIGFENGTESNDKAEGNITGSYGRSPNPRKARNFLGLTRSEIKEIVRSVRENEE